MATYVIILTSIGTDAGPFNLYSDIDGFIAPFAINVTSAELLAGYSTSLIPVGTIEVKVLSISGCTNYEYLTVPVTTTTTSTTIPLFNFDVENSDWSAIGVTDQASFEAYMLLHYSGMSGMVVTDFSLVNDGSIKCNIVFTPSDSTHHLRWTNSGVYKINNISSLYMATEVTMTNSGLIVIENFEPFVNVTRFELADNPISVYGGLNSCTATVNIDLSGCIIDTITNMPNLTQLIALRLDDNLITTPQWDNLNPWALVCPNGGTLEQLGNIDSISTSTTYTTLSGKSWTIVI
jgi:hypothetical protein